MWFVFGILVGEVPDCRVGIRKSDLDSAFAELSEPAKGRSGIPIEECVARFLWLLPDSKGILAAPKASRVTEWVLAAKQAHQPRRAP